MEINSLDLASDLDRTTYLQSGLKGKEKHIGTLKIDAILLALPISASLPLLRK
jgi:hypothetical protein